MKGRYNILIQSKRLKYEFTIQRNITVLRGNSATGKTTLINMIAEYSRDGEDSGITLDCAVPCEVLSGKNWESDLQKINNSIVFIDEGNRFITSNDFAHAVKHSSNYYVIVTREALDGLPYSINEIYNIKESGRYGSTKQVYNSMYRLYASNTLDKEIKPTHIITEDSNTGFQFFNSLGISCEPADGKTNIVNKITDKDSSEVVLIIADGAALGPNIEDIVYELREHSNYYLYAPESFEWLLLKAGIFNSAVHPNTKTMGILKNPSNYIESSKYFSWERFFTSYLVAITNDMDNKDEMLGYKYPSDKGDLPQAYLQKSVVNRVLQVMEGINLTK